MYCWGQQSQSQAHWDPAGDARYSRLTVCIKCLNTQQIVHFFLTQFLPEISVAERATISSAGAAVDVQPRLSPLPPFSAFPSSSSQHSSSTNPASSISQPHPAPLALPTMPVKQEQQTVSCNPDTPQVPVNQPVTLFPHDLLPSLLLTSSHLAAPTTSVTSLKQLKTISSLSASPSPESSVRQQEQVTRERWKDSVTKVRLARDKADSDTEEEMGGNLGPTTDKPTLVPESEPQNDSAGNESDDSVEMMEPSNLEIIDIDESDNEETVSSVPVQREPPEKSVSVEFSAVSTQTFQQNEDERWGHYITLCLVSLLFMWLSLFSCDHSEKFSPLLCQSKMPVVFQVNIVSPVCVELNAHRTCLDTKINKALKMSF